MINILCNSAWIKVNEIDLKNMKYIQDHTMQPVQFHIFAGLCHKIPCFINFIQAQLNSFGIKFYKIYQYEQFDQVIAVMKDCHIGILTAQGGFTTVLEGLQCSVPMFCTDGE